MQAKALGAFALWAAAALTLVLPSVASPQHSVLQPRTPAPTHIDDGSSPSTTSATSDIVLESRGYATTIRRHDLRKRQGLRLFHAEHVKQIIPAQLAVPGLKLFYSALIAFVERDWRLNAALEEVILSLGNLRLQMTSATPIAWDFVTRFSQKMLTTAALGFTGTYNIIYADQETGQIVTVTLRVVDHRTGLDVRSNAPNAFQAALSSSTSAIPHALYKSYRMGRTIDKRAQFFMNFKGDAWELKAIIMPAVLAVQMTKAFYESVINKAFDEQWKPSPSSSLFTISEGAFELTVSCLGGAVPMEMLYTFGQRMVDFASQGWLPVYDVYYNDELTGARVAIAFRILDAGLPLLQPSKPSGRSTSASPIINSAPVLHDRSLNKRSYRSKHDPRSFAGLRRNKTFPILSRRGPNNQVSTHLLPIKFQLLAMITPIRMASLYLEDFYNNIALKIETGYWNAVSPRHFVTFERWNFQLTFFSYAETVPWDFIQNFVIEVSEYAAKGFTSSYEATFGAMKATGEVYISVTLRLLDKAAAGAIPGA